MAYVNLLSDDDFTFQSFQLGASNLVEALVGYNDLEDISYSLRVSLDVMPGGFEYELRFCIHEYDGSTESDFDYFSAKDVATKIPGQHKAATRACLLRGIETLITNSRPEKVFLCTVDTYAPLKANRKFILIAELFEGMGYEVKTADPYNGQRVWWMTRPGHPEVEQVKSKDQDHGS